MQCKDQHNKDETGTGKQQKQKINQHSIKQETFKLVNYPSKQGIPRAIPRSFASFIMREKTDPIFLLREETAMEFTSSGITW